MLIHIVGLFHLYPLQQILFSISSYILVLIRYAIPPPCYSLIYIDSYYTQPSCSSYSQKSSTSTLFSSHLIHSSSFVMLFDVHSYTQVRLIHPVVLIHPSPLQQNPLKLFSPVISFTLLQSCSSLLSFSLTPICQYFAHKLLSSIHSRL